MDNQETQDRTDNQDHKDSQGRLGHQGSKGHKALKALRVREDLTAIQAPRDRQVNQGDQEPPVPWALGELLAVPVTRVHQGL